MLILTVLQGPDKGRRFELPDYEPQMIGRSSEALPLLDQTISRRHAEMTPDDGRWMIRDLHSANGTFVNGVRVRERRLLEPGDQVRTGKTLFLFGQEASVPPRRTGVRVGRKDEINAHVEMTTPSSDESMIMAVPEPSEVASLQLRVIYELTQIIGSIENKQELLERIMDVVFEYLQPDRGFILLQDKPDQRPDPIVIRHRISAENEEQQRTGRLPEGRSPIPITVSRTIVQHVMQKNEGVLSSNAQSDTRFMKGDSVHGLGIRSAICVPIRFKERLFGVVHIDSLMANYTFTEDQLKLLTAIGVQTGMALANFELYEQRVQRERLAAVGETVASLSHSVKNIIQGLRGGAEVVDIGLRKQDLNVVTKGWHIVTRNLDRISNLTMNMLAFSKRRKPEVEMTNLGVLLDEVVELVQKQFDAKQVAIISDLDHNMPPAPVDPGGIHQAMLNLLNNALEAVESETGVVTLTCDYDAPQHQVVIRVADNGHGMDNNTRRNLFEPFHSTKGMRGTGLGLVVTKKIIDEHGGAIDVESAPNQGTTFTITLTTQMDHIPASADTHAPGASV